MISNYPCGSENDPNAPWNDRPQTEFEPVTKEKEPCDRCDQFNFLNDDGLCEDCFEPQDITEEDIADMKADEALDRMKDGE